MQALALLWAEKKRPWVISLAAHLFFLLLAALYQVGFSYKSAEFIEVGMISGSLNAVAPTREPVESRPASPAAETTIKSAAAPLRQPRIIEKTSAQRTVAKPTTRVAQPQTHPVTPPSRRMLEDEEPQLAGREQGKLTPDLAAASSTRDVTPNASLSDAAYSDATGRSGAGQREPGLGRSGSGSSNSGSDQPFTIEGDAAQRTILHQVIPEYPNGLQKEEVLKIRFTVLPDGRVSLTIPMRKGDPTLEKISLEALRQWRFNSLPASAQQKNVTGIITFRYELQ